MLFILHRINVTSLIRTNSLIGTDFFGIGTPLFGLARVYCNDHNGNNDNIRAGAKSDAGGGAETSFPLTVA